MQNGHFLDNPFFNRLAAVGFSYPGWLALRMLTGHENFPTELFWVYLPFVLLGISVLWYGNKLIRRKERSTLEWASLLIIALASQFLVTALQFVSQTYQLGDADRTTVLGLTWVLGASQPLGYSNWLLVWYSRKTLGRRTPHAQTS